jgi:hypothetical protein
MSQAGQTIERRSTQATDAKSPPQSCTRAKSALQKPSNFNEINDVNQRLIRLRHFSQSVEIHHDFPF